MPTPTSLPDSMDSSTTENTGRIGQAAHECHHQYAPHSVNQIGILRGWWLSKQLIKPLFKDSLCFQIAKEAMACFGERNRQLGRKRWTSKIFLYTAEYTEFQMLQNKALTSK